MVGTGRAPSTEDKLRMPYTNAVIHELQRFHRTRIENFPRMTTQDVLFRGYTIPKVHRAAPEPLSPRERWQGGLSEICLCPWTVCTRLKVMGLSQSSVAVIFRREAGAGECHCLSCPHPPVPSLPVLENSSSHHGAVQGCRARAGAHPGVGLGQPSPALGRSGDSHPPGVSTSIVCKAHPEGTSPAFGFGAVRGV